MKYPYGLACYPKKWKQFVVSPKKICIQFDDVQCKTRAPLSKDGLQRTNKGTHAMPIDTHGTDIQTLAVGIPIDLYPELLKQIFIALNEHGDKEWLHKCKSAIWPYLD